LNLNKKDKISFWDFNDIGLEFDDMLGLKLSDLHLTHIYLVPNNTVQNKDVVKGGKVLGFLNRMLPRTVKSL